MNLKPFLLTSLVLLLTACGSDSTVTPPSPEPEKSIPQESTLPEGETFRNNELIVYLLDGYTGENSDAFTTQITGEDARLLIFKTEGSDPSKYEEPQEKMHAGREVYGYDLYLYYANPEAGEEIREIAENTFVIQQYRNGANSITFTFPQDWLFSARNNNRMCMSPFNAGNISEENNSCNGVLNLDIYPTLAEAETAASTLDAPETGSIWTQELNGKGLVVTLTSDEHLTQAQQILSWSAL